MILITGSTGNLGKATISYLLKKINAKEIAALARNEEKSAELKSKGVDVRIGDFTNKDSLVKALRGFRSEGAVTIGFLKERMLDKNSYVSRIVNKLFRKGLVSRKENKVDRRQKDLEITEKGVALISEMVDCEKKADTLLQN